MDNRLVVLKGMHAALQRSFRWKQPDSNETLRKSPDVLSLQIRRDVMLCVKTCKESNETGKTFEPILILTPYGKLSRVKMRMMRIL